MSVTIGPGVGVTVITVPRTGAVKAAPVVTRMFWSTVTPAVLALILFACLLASVASCKNASAPELGGVVVDSRYKFGTIGVVAPEAPVPSAPRTQGIGPAPAGRVDGLVFAL